MREMTCGVWNPYPLDFFQYPVPFFVLNTYRPVFLSAMAAETKCAPAILVWGAQQKKGWRAVEEGRQADGGSGGSLEGTKLTGVGPYNAKIQYFP